MLPLVRNDDAPWGVTLGEFKSFCDVCDKNGFKIIQALTIWGDCSPIDASWDNEKIILETHKKMIPREFIDYLLTRDDFIGTHGYDHTHRPSFSEQALAKKQLEVWGFKPTYAVLPFNEESPEYRDEVLGMKVLGNLDRLEDYLPGMPKFGTIPTAEISYLHSWRFFHGWYSLKDLDDLLSSFPKT